MGFENYVRENSAFPVSRFWGRFDDASRCIGYGKSAFVFHMLRRRLGDDVFSGAIKEFVREYSFQVAAWDDIREVFEKAAGADLTAFISQWVHDVGIPELELADVHYARVGSAGEISFTVMQKGAVYDLLVPVSVYTQKGRQTAWLAVDRETNVFTLPVAAEPSEIVLDEAFDVFRKLSVAETPPLVERLITDEKVIIIQPSFTENLYASVFADFEKKDIRRGLFWERAQLTDQDIASSSLLILGADDLILRRLGIEVEKIDMGFGVMARKNPLNARKVVAIVLGKSKEEIELGWSAVVDCPKNSNLFFDRGKLMRKERLPAANGIRAILR